MSLHCGGLREPHPCPASHSGWCKQHWFPSCQNPVSLEIIAKLQFCHRDLSWAPGVLTFRVGLKRPSVCPSRCSHLLSSASPGAQERAKILRERPSCPLGTADGLWLSASGGARLHLDLWKCGVQVPHKLYYCQGRDITHFPWTRNSTHTHLHIKIWAAVSQSEQECKFCQYLYFNSFADILAANGFKLSSL